MSAVTTKREESVAEIQRLIRKMRVPAYRKSSTSTENMRWLNRNLGVVNSGHANYSKVMELLKEVI